MTKPYLVCLVAANVKLKIKLVTVTSSFIYYLKNALLLFSSSDCFKTEKRAEIENILPHVLVRHLFIEFREEEKGKESCLWRVLNFTFLLHLIYCVLFSATSFVSLTLYLLLTMYIDWNQMFTTILKHIINTQLNMRSIYCQTFYNRGFLFLFSENFNKRIIPFATVCAPAGC